MRWNYSYFTVAQELFLFYCAQMHKISNWCTLWPMSLISYEWFFFSSYALFPPWRWKLVECEILMFFSSLYLETNIENCGSNFFTEPKEPGYSSWIDLKLGKITCLFYLWSGFFMWLEVKIFHMALKLCGRKTVRVTLGFSFISRCVEGECGIFHNSQWYDLEITLIILHLNLFCFKCFFFLNVWCEFSKYGVLRKTSYFGLCYLCSLPSLAE